MPGSLFQSSGGKVAACEGVETRVEGMHLAVLQHACIYLVYWVQYCMGKSQFCVYPCQVRISLVPRLSERKIIVQATESWVGPGNVARSGCFQN